jgi:hypothetical protein
MWLLFQMLVMLAVGWTAVYFDWQHQGGWDHGGTAIGVVMVGAAWLSTVVLSKSIDAVRWVRTKRRELALNSAVRRAHH